MKSRRTRTQTRTGVIVLAIFLVMLTTVVSVGYRIVCRAEPDLSLCPFCDQTVQHNR